VVRRRRVCWVILDAADTVNASILQHSELHEPLDFSDNFAACATHTLLPPLSSLFNVPETRHRILLTSFGLIVFMSNTSLDIRQCSKSPLQLNPREPSIHTRIVTHNHLGFQSSICRSRLSQPLYAPPHCCHRQNRSLSRLRSSCQKGWVVLEMQVVYAKYVERDSPMNSLREHRRVSRRRG
jgi:hypothetical protein